MQRGLDGGVATPPAPSPAGGHSPGPQRRAARTAGALFVALTLAAGAARAADTPPGVRDPFEHLNRATYAFNDALDRMLARPAARAYKTVVPRPVREIVSNFLANLDYPTVLVNDALQGKLLAAGHDVARMAINTTLGIGGLFDPATRWGLTANDEDFGQTLGVWGFGPGPYLVMPFLGPSDFRDAPGDFVDRYTNVSHYLRPRSRQYYVMLGGLLDRRTSLLAADAAVDTAFDPYTFVRNSYLQRREYRVRDGNLPEETYDDELPAAGAAAPATAPAEAKATPAAGAMPPDATNAAAAPAAATPAAATPDVSAESPPPAASPPPR